MCCATGSSYLPDHVCQMDWTSWHKSPKAQQQQCAVKQNWNDETERNTYTKNVFCGIAAHLVTHLVSSKHWFGSTLQGEGQSGTGCALLIAERKVSKRERQWSRSGQEFSSIPLKSIWLLHFAPCFGAWSYSNQALSKLCPWNGTKPFRFICSQHKSARDVARYPAVTLSLPWLATTEEWKWQNNRSSLFWLSQSGDLIPPKCLGVSLPFMSSLC